MNNSGNDHEAEREAVISSFSETTTNSSNTSFLRSISNNSNPQGSPLNRLRPRSIYIKQESSGSERDSTVTSSTATGSTGFHRPTGILCKY